MKKLKLAIDIVFAGIIVLFLYLLCQEVVLMYLNHNGITFGQFVNSCIFYVWIFFWTIGYWNGFIWVIEHRVKAWNWLKPKLDFLVLGILAFSYLFERLFIDGLGDPFPRPFSTYAFLLTFFIYIASWFFVKLFPRFAYSLKVLSLAMVWFIFTCLLFLKLIVFPLM